MASSWRCWAASVARRRSSSCRLRSNSASPTHLGQVGVQQPLLLALQLAQGLAEGRLAGLELLGQPRPAPGPLQRRATCAGSVSSAHRSAQTSSSSCAAGV